MGGGFAFRGRLERSAAAATPRGLGILQSEARPGEVVRVVERRARDELRAFRIDDHFHPIPHGNRIAIRDFIESHAVLQPGASAFFDKNAEAFRRLALFGDECLKLARSGFGDRDHGRRS